MSNKEVVILYQKVLTDKVTFEQGPERNKRAGHADI